MSRSTNGSGAGLSPVSESRAAESKPQSNHLQNLSPSRRHPHKKPEHREDKQESLAAGPGCPGTRVSVPDDGTRQSGGLTPSPPAPTLSLAEGSDWIPTSKASGWGVAEGLCLSICTSTGTRGQRAYIHETARQRAKPPVRRSCPWCSVASVRGCRRRSSLLRLA